MKTRYVLTISAIFLAVLFVVAGCGGGSSAPPASNTLPPIDAPSAGGDDTENVEKDDEESDTVTLIAEQIAGPGSILLYKGIEYDGQLDVPTNALVGVIKESRGYLYHPAMGTDVDFSSESDKVAMGYFMLSHHSNATNVAKANMSQDSAFGSITMKVLPNHEETELATRIKIKRVDNMLTITNNASRWAAVKIIDGDSIKKYFLLPINMGIDSNLMRHVLGNEDLQIDGIDPSDFSAAALSVNVSSSAIIETYGATIRGNGYFYYKNARPEGHAEALKQDQQLFVKLNSIDYYHTILEGIKHLLGQFPFECADVISGHSINMIEADIIGGFMTEEERVETDLYRIWKQDIYDSVARCIGIWKTAGWGEIFNSFWDILGLFSYTINDLILYNNAIIHASAYDRTSLDPILDYCFVGGSWDIYYKDVYAPGGQVLIERAYIQFLPTGRWIEIINDDAKSGYWSVGNPDFSSNYMIMDIDSHNMIQKHAEVWDNCSKMTVDVLYGDHKDAGYEYSQFIYERPKE